MRLLAELPPWVIDLGSAAGVIVAVTAALALITRARPVRWIWRVTIADPVSRWAASVVGDAVADVSQRLTDHMKAEEGQRQVDSIERTHERDRLTEWRDLIDAKLDEGNGRMGALERGHAEIKDMLATTLDELKAGNPEVRA